MNYSSQERFWEYLERKIEIKQGRVEVRDRAALAVLRRGLNDFGRDFSIYTVLGPVLPADLSDRDIQLYLLAGCLFAVHPTPKGGAWSLGWTLNRLRSQLKVGQESLDKRFAALLNSDLEDLPIHLRHMIRLLQSRDGYFPVNYRHLLSDLLKWERDDRVIQRRWAQDYWAPLADKKKDSDELEETKEISTENPL